MRVLEVFIEQASDHDRLVFALLENRLVKSLKNKPTRALYVDLSADFSNLLP